MNPETAQAGVLALGTGAAVVYDEPLALNTRRSPSISSLGRYVINVQIEAAEAVILLSGLDTEE